MWMVSAKKADFNKLSGTFHIDPVVARIIRNRDVMTEEQMDKYLNGSLADLYDPCLLKNLDEAARFVAEKVQHGTSVRIIGDYDIDGICSTYILYRGLLACDADVDYAIPHRIKDGYGINEHLIEQCVEDHRQMIITCDNGIAAHAPITYAKEKGIHVVVTDHHEVPYVEVSGEKIYKLPPADYVIDPKQADDIYPNPEICGAVVAWKFLHRLFFHCELDTVQADKLLEELLEEAAFATVGDVMELLDENRILVKYGLRKLEHTENVGIRALLQVLGLSGKQLTAYHIGFLLGPCMNATGRLDTAKRALELLCCTNPVKAGEIATELKDLNDSRKAMTEEGVQQAKELIENTDLLNDPVLVVYLPGCHESLAGIIAGRIKEHYYKPTIVLTDAEDGVKGSARSIEAYHMFEKLSECKALLTKFGGHKMAAGLSLEKDNILRLREQLNQNCGLSKEALVKKVVIDVPMPLSYVSYSLLSDMEKLEPFGNGNSKPVFACKNITFLSGKVMGKNKNVGKYQVRDENGYLYEMVCFQDLEGFHAFLDAHFGEREREALYEYGKKTENITLSVIYYPDINEYQGRKQIQYILQDYRCN